jgi:tetraacyldisaccharide 4'-kinase
VGDEPLLLAEHTPTWVAVDRYRAACKAAESGAQLLVADDGFHNPRLRAETSILVYDAVQGAGNGALFPAGPLRAPLEEILSRTTLVLSLGGPFPYATSAPVLRADLSPVFPESLKGRRLLAFAGLGYPEKFFHTLRAQQAQLVETHVFPDHHFYTEAELRDLLQQAEAYGADLMTTRKDFVRIPDSMRAQISSLEVSWTWRSPEQSRRLLEQLVRG